MKQAIVLPYATYQNEPSIPLRTLIDVPENEAELEATLRSIFLTRVCDDEEIVNDCVLRKKSGYGDMEYGTEDMMLFLTFLD